jgi:hypothetical protein
MFQVIIQKKSIMFQRIVQRVSDNTPKQRKQSSLALLYGQHARKVACQIIPQKKNVNF